LLKILLKTTAILEKNYEKRKGFFLKRKYIGFSESNSERIVKIGVHLPKL